MGRFFREIVSFEGFSMRAVERIKRKQARAIELAWKGYTLPQIARMKGAPCLRTLRSWCQQNLNGFGKEYKYIRNDRICDRIMERYEEKQRAIWRRAGLEGEYIRQRQAEFDRIVRNAEETVKRAKAEGYPSKAS